MSTSKRVRTYPYRVSYTSLEEYLNNDHPTVFTDDVQGESAEDARTNLNSQLDPILFLGTVRQPKKGQGKKRKLKGLHVKHNAKLTQRQIETLAEQAEKWKSSFKAESPEDYVGVDIASSDSDDTTAYYVGVVDTAPSDDTTAAVNTTTAAVTNTLQTLDVQPIPFLSPSPVVEEKPWWRKVWESITG